MRSEAAGMEKLLLSVKEAASLLGIGRSSLYLLFRDGKILPLKVNNRTVVTPDSLKRFVDRLEREALEHDLCHHLD